MAPQTKYKPEYVQEVVQMMSEGLFDFQICAKWGISRGTFYNWKNDFTEFKEACEMGDEICYDWWVTEGKKRFAERDERGFKYWMAIMNAKFHWNKTETKNNTNNIYVQGNMTVLEGKSNSELSEILQQKLTKLSAYQEVPQLVQDAEVIDVRPESE